MKQDMTPYGNIVRRLIERENKMKSLNVLKAEAAIRRFKIANEDSAHEYYMGRKPYKEHYDEVHTALFTAHSEIAVIIEALEEEIKRLKEGGKEHEEITIIGCN